MKIFFRTLLAIYAFCLAVFSAFAMYVAIRPDAYVAISEQVIDAISTDNATGLRIAVFATALVFFALSIMFLLSGVRSNKDKKAVGKQTEIGEILISLNSIENIAINASRKTNGVRDSKTMVRKTDNGVEIESRLVVMPEMSIPAITEDVQQRVKKSVEDTAGVRVESVKVIVDNIYSGITYKPRVE
jgi:uncharacterized alkaline shock family protein YloU